MFDLAIATSLGLVLAASCGLRAFLPLFLVSALGAGGWIDLASPVAWMGTPLAAACFGSAVVVEVLADKIPVVDHAMDAVGLVLRPAAGSVAAMSMMNGADPLALCVFGLAAGGLVAGKVQVAKAGTRAGSTLTTGGLGNPVLSVVEDVVALGAGGAAAAAAVMI